MATDLVLEGYGIGVNKMQAYLNMMQERGFITTRNLQDGVYGARTRQAVREWQTFAGLSVDGQIGDLTFDSLVNALRTLNIQSDVPVASPNFYLSGANTGLSVFKMQEYLNEIAKTNKCLRPITVDGIYGPETTAAVQQFQYLSGLPIDGIIGAVTWDDIINQRNAIPTTK